MTPGQRLQVDWMEQARNHLIELSGSIAHDAMNPGLMALLISIQTTIALLEQEIRKRRYNS